MKLGLLIGMLFLATPAIGGPLHWVGHAVAHCPVMRVPAKATGKTAKGTAKGAAKVSKGIAKGVAAVAKAVY